MNKQEALKALEDDTNYYGDFGKKYLSNSDISTLLTNPLALGQKIKQASFSSWRLLSHSYS